VDALESGSGVILESNRSSPRGELFPVAVREAFGTQTQAAGGRLLFLFSALCLLFSALCSLGSDILSTNSLLFRELRYVNLDSTSQVLDNYWRSTRQVVEQFLRTIEPLLARYLDDLGAVQDDDVVVFGCVPLHRHVEQADPAGQQVVVLP